MSTPGPCELTRYRDGLAAALGHAGSESRVIPGGDWAAHMFAFDTHADANLLRPVAAAYGEEQLTFSTLIQHLRVSLGFGEGRSAAFAARYRAP